MSEAQQRAMGRRVDRLRTNQGMTTEALAQKAGLSVKTVSRFINGRHEPRTGTIEKLAKALKVPEREIRGTPPSPFQAGDNGASTSRLEAKLDWLIDYLVTDEQARQEFQAAFPDGEPPPS